MARAAFRKEGEHMSIKGKAYIVGAYEHPLRKAPDKSVAQIHAEVEDRYGRIPRSVENLFEYARLRKLAERMAIVSIDKTADGVAIKLGETARVAPEKLMQFVNENEGSNFSPTGILRVKIETAEPIASATEALEAIKL